MPSEEDSPNPSSGLPHFASSQSYGGVQAPQSERKLERKFSKIDDNYSSLEQVR